MVLDRLRCPVVLAPLAGGPSTPELAAAVSNAGGLGFVATGYLKAADAATRLEAARELTSQPLGVNVFGRGAPADPAAYQAYVETFQEWADRHGVQAGAPRYDDDDWDAKIELLVSSPPQVVSFTFGCPPAEVVRRLRDAGCEVWVTITSADEAREAAGVGADVLVVQGAEAGGHRGSFRDRSDLPAYGLLPLLQLVGAAGLPLVASGGIMTGRALAAVLCAGARAAQLGTAFMLAEEAGTNAAHRAALKAQGETVLTRAFTGRLARGIRNEFIDAHEPRAPIAYPEVHYLTSPMRKQARERGDTSQINLWAGEAHELAVERPAAEIVHELTSSALAALAEVLTSPWARAQIPSPPRS